MPRSVVFAAVLTALLLLAAWVLFVPFYETNDDVGMRLMVEGHFAPGQAPSGFTLFINAVVGKALAAANTWWPGPPWYDLALLGFTLTAVGILLYANLDPVPGLGWLVVAALAVHLLLPILVSCQFTHTAMVLASAGLALLTRVALMDLPPRARRLHLGLGLLLIVTGSLVRVDAVALAVLVGALLALPLVGARARDGWQHSGILAAALALAGSVVLAGALFAVDFHLYAGEAGWREFRRYNSLLRRLEYAPRGRTTPAVLATLRREVGWSAVDLMMLRSWFFTDPDRFSIDRLRAAVGVLAPQRLTGLRKGLNLDELGGAALGFLGDARKPLLLLAAVAVLRLSRRLLLYLAYAITVVAVMVTLMTVGLKTVPHRVYWGLLILLATFLGAAVRSHGGRVRSWTWPLAACLILAVVGSGARQLASLSRLTRGWSSMVEREVAELKGLRRDVVTVIQGDSFPYQVYWRPMRPPRQPFSVVPIAAAARTPPVLEFLRRTGREDLALSLCSDPDLWLITKPRFTSILAEYLLEHRGLHVEFRPKFEGSFRAYRCRIVGEEDSSQ